MALAVMLVLATTFVLAAVAKLRHRASFQAVLAVVAGRRAAPPLALAVPALELALAAALLAGIQPRAAAILTLAVLLTFSWALLRLQAQPRNPPCTCFGSGGGDPRGGLKRNAALAALAVALVLAPHRGAVTAASTEDLVGAATVALGAACAWHLTAVLVPVRRTAQR
jgi:uncharacterized membrane protein YphA (DoxX/SURF4 family)